MSKIHEYTAAETVNQSDMVIIDIENGGNYVNKCATVEKVNQACEFAKLSDVDTTGASTGDILVKSENGFSTTTPTTYSTITTQSFSLDDLSVANNTDYNYQIDVTKTGYTPIGIIQSSFIGNYGTRFHFCKLNIASNTCNVSFRANAESFSTTGFQVLIVVLYVKS